MKINDIKKRFPETNNNHPTKPSYRMMTTCGNNILKLWNGRGWIVLLEKNGVLVDSENNIFEIV